VEAGKTYLSVTMEAVWVPFIGVNNGGGGVGKVIILFF